MQKLQCKCKTILVLQYRRYRYSPAAILLKLFKARQAGGGLRTVERPRESESALLGGGRRPGALHSGVWRALLRTVAGDEWIPVESPAGR